RTLKSGESKNRSWLGTFAWGWGHRITCDVRIPGITTVVDTLLLAIPCANSSFRLGNNDVSEKSAQQASCLAPKIFSATLSTVRAALQGYLTTRSAKETSFEGLARQHGVTNDAIYWMEEVEKAVKKSGGLEALHVDEGVVTCMI
ncbi:hypothetical protein L7U65_26890, partial [Klebsiella pneumoniae]|uniref:hypothetical protein n=1 Tax=Klebsiella pneumoniae TaxID=573 RepID=UPI0022375878